MSVEVTIICDACGQVIAAEATAIKGRDRVRLYGGKTSLPGGKDICGPCVAGGRAING